NPYTLTRDARSHPGHEHQGYEIPSNRRMAGLHVVVLAAGKGTRMKSRMPKVVHEAAGLPLIDHVLRTANRLNPAAIVVIGGHQADAIRLTLGERLGLAFASQEP